MSRVEGLGVWCLAACQEMVQQVRDRYGVAVKALYWGKGEG